MRVVNMSVRLGLCRMAHDVRVLVCACMCARAHTVVCVICVGLCGEYVSVCVVSVCASASVADVCCTRIVQHPIFHRLQSVCVCVCVCVCV